MALHCSVQRKGSPRPLLQKGAGYTLVEVLVAVSIFSIIFALASGYFISTIAVQRETAAAQPMVNETSFFAEYLSRAFRPAQRAPDSSCIPQGLYYEITSANDDAVRFIDKEDRCREIYLSAGVLREDIEGVDEAITSSVLDVQNFQVEVAQPAAGETIPHPRVAFFLEVRPVQEAMNIQTLHLQTTISQREF